MRKYAIPFFLIIAALAIVAVFAYNFFEIYEKPTYKSPSSQARSNEYLAMERWLNKTGHAVRVIPHADASKILSASEKTVVLFASVFNWQADTYSNLEQWAESGKNLVICLDIEEEEAEDAGLVEFLAKLGVTVNFSDSRMWWGSFGISNDDFPTFSDYIDFTINSAQRKTELTAIEDASGKIRLVSIPIKTGSIAVCDEPIFMLSYHLDKETNALLSWQLTAGQDDEKNGVLFVRGVITEPGFFGKLAEQGNFLPLLISVLVLIFIGFWMVIPVFGFLTGDAELPGKPIKERFLAEARFLKKYKGLGSYLEIYYLSLRQRFCRKYGEVIVDEFSFFSRIAEICDLNTQDVAEALHPQAHGSAATSREFLKHIYTIETIMERL